ncbi:MAG: response regulator [Pseudomonadota bacterium]
MVTVMENSLFQILIVEDSPTQVEQLRFILEKRGYKVIVARNGKEALQVLQHTLPDVVMSDIVMPEMDGYELCRQIRKDARLKNIPVILVTTLSDPTDVIRGLEVGANNFITKPYDERYLVSRLQYLITNMEMRRDSSAEMGINVYFSGKNYFISAERLQILDLLLSTYENAYLQNRDLQNAQKELQELNERLEDIVRERTSELLSANNQLKIELAERLRAEEEKVNLQAQLHQAQRMESVGRLAGGVAHDYNNMLSVILGFTQMALDKIDQNSPLYNDLQEVLSAAKRSTGITRQLLAFARKQNIMPIILDLNTAVADMLKMLRRLIGENIDLTWQPDADLWMVKIDPSQIDQLMANLCVNARDAITGVGKITIKTGKVVFDSEYSVHHPRTKPGKYVFIEVGDNGCGMQKEIVDKIFDPFFTTKGVGHGTGLGLSTVYGIVETHLGFINVFSTPGQGTTFTIYLPKYHGEVDEKGEELPGITMRGRGETILVVEDDPAILRLTKRMLKDAGYTVLTADGPNQAIAITRETVTGVHLLLTDVIMPDMNGRDLADELLKINPNLKCLFMSGYTANVILNQGNVSQGTNFIQKPFSGKDLATKIHQILAC